MTCGRCGSLLISTIEGFCHRCAINEIAKLRSQIEYSIRVEEDAIAKLGDEVFLRQNAEKEVERLKACGEVHEELVRKYVEAVAAASNLERELDAQVKDSELDMVELKRENEVLREKVLWPPRGKDFTILRSKDYVHLVKIEESTDSLWKSIEHSRKEKLEFRKLNNRYRKSLIDIKGLIWGDVDSPESILAQIEQIVDRLLVED